MRRKIYTHIKITDFSAKPALNFPIVMLNSLRIFLNFIYNTIEELKKGIKKVPAATMTAGTFFALYRYYLSFSPSLKASPMRSVTL